MSECVVEGCIRGAGCNVHRRAPSRYDVRDGTGRHVRCFLVSADGRWQRDLDPYNGKPIGGWRRVTS